MPPTPPPPLPRHATAQMASTRTASHTTRQPLAPQTPTRPTKRGLACTVSLYVRLYACPHATRRGTHTLGLMKPSSRRC